MGFIYCYTSRRGLNHRYNMKTLLACLFFVMFGCSWIQTSDAVPVYPIEIILPGSNHPKELISSESVHPQKVRMFECAGQAHALHGSITPGAGFCQAVLQKSVKANIG